MGPIKNSADVLRLWLKKKPFARDFLIHFWRFAHDCNSFPFNLIRNYKHALEIKRGYAKLSNFPDLYIETINQCNAHCVMCPVHKLTRPVGCMDWKLYQKIIDEAAEFHTGPLLLSNYGEPLLDTLLLERIEYAKKSGFKVVFYTNGWLLNEKISKGLIQSGLDTIKISVVAAYPLTYKKIYCGGSLEKVKKNIMQLLYLKDIYKSDRPLVLLKYIRMAENRGELAPFFKQWKSKVDCIGVSDGLSSRSHSIKKQFVRKIIYKRDNPCMWPFHNLVIFPNGDVTLCCEDWDGKVIIGNVGDITILDLWRSDRMKQIRESMLKCDWPSLPSICKICTCRVTPSSESWWW